MSGIGAGRRGTVAVAGALAVTVGSILAGGAAHADEAFPVALGSNVEGGGDDGGVYARVQGIRFEGAVSDGGAETGNLSPTVTNWSPPPCWYAPYKGAKAFKAEYEPAHEGAVNNDEITGTARTAVGQVRAHYQSGYDFGEDRQGYEDYNVEKDGEGMFWKGFPNPGEPDPLKRDSCNDLAFWVDNGDPPPAYAADESIDPQMLADLAYERMNVPETEAELRPAGKQTVNLPTWVWLDDATFEPVEVTASVPALNIWATTTATPESLTIEPGTEDADVHPASGTCAINDDGSIGTPYTRGNAGKTPPCGMTYLRSTQKTGPFPFKATVTWNITWSGSDGTENQQMPDGVLDATQDVTVQEIQTVIN